MKTTLLRLAALLAALVSSLAVGAAAPVMPGQLVVEEKAVGPAPRLRLTEKAASAPKALLGPITAGEIASVRSRNRSASKRVTIGINRDLQGDALPEGRELAWSPVEDGLAARFSVASPEAAALRVGLDLRGVHPDVEMVFFGSEDARLLGPVRVGAIADRTGTWWSPVTEGDVQTIEVFLPRGVSPPKAGLRVVSASHLFTGAGGNFRKRTADIGDSGACNLDIACKAGAPQGFLNARNAVAKMVFTDGFGTGLCTGTLLADSDPSTTVGWFISGNHCFDNSSAPFKTATQMQTVANTLQTYWFFEAVACNSLTPGGFVQRTGGAQFLYNNVGSDVLFVRLIDSPPAGAYTSGWNANYLQAGTPVTGIHHPQGDLKMYAEGAAQGNTTPFSNATASAFTEVRWSEGTTEGGSSGSGLWTVSSGEYYFRGGLWGGAASCSSLTSPDHYSRFDLAYPALASFLASNTPFADFSDIWYNPAESGWGMSLTQHASNKLFAIWYTYDSAGKLLWVVLPDGQWTSNNTYTGPLYITSGPPQTGAFNPALVKVNTVGTGTLTFSTANNGTWTYTINGVSGVKTITRQAF